MQSNVRSRPTVKAIPIVEDNVRYYVPRMHWSWTDQWNILSGKWLGMIPFKESKEIPTANYDNSPRYESLIRYKTDMGQSCGINEQLQNGEYSL